MTTAVGNPMRAWEAKLSEFATLLFGSGRKRTYFTAALWTTLVSLVHEKKTQVTSPLPPTHVIKADYEAANLGLCLQADKTLWDEC